MKRLLFLCLLVFPLLCDAQSLSLKNGDEVKIFPADTYYDLVFGAEDKPCCVTNVSGTITRILKDSIVILANVFEVKSNDINFLLENVDDIAHPKLSYTLPKDELYSLRGYKSNKKKKTRQNLQIWGGILLTTGLITLANSYDIDDTSFREGVLLSGGIQVGASILIFALSSKKKYLVRDGWRF